METIISKETVESVEFSLKYFISDRGHITEHYIISKTGISITSESDFSTISYCLPVYYSNGIDFGLNQIEKGFCSVKLFDFIYDFVLWSL